MYLNGKKVLVAGATGMVGFCIIEHILKNFPRAAIRAAYHKNTKPFLKDRRIEYVCADLLTPADCLKAAYGCDAAVMAAAVTDNAATFAQGTNYFSGDNVMMNMNLLKAFTQTKVARVVFLSSATVYSELSTPIKESDLDFNQEPNARQFFIGWSFRFIEKMCRFWHIQTSKDMIILRLSNIFGPWARFDPRRSNFIPALIRKASDKINPFTVWGNPSVERDVLYSEDAACAVAAAINKIGVKNDCFNVGSGVGFKVSSAVECVTQCVGYRPQIKYDTRKPVTVKSRVLDITKIARVLNWRPQYTPQEGIIKTFAWWQENKRRWKK